MAKRKETRGRKKLPGVVNVNGKRLIIPNLSAQYIEKNLGGLSNEAIARLGINEREATALAKQYVKKKGYKNIDIINTNQHTVSTPILKQVVERMTREANKIIRAFEKQNISTPAMENLKGKFSAVISKKKRDGKGNIVPEHEQLLLKMRRLKNFMSSKTSSMEGYQQFSEKLTDLLGGDAGSYFYDEDTRKVFWKALKSLKEDSEFGKAFYQYHYKELMTETRVYAEGHNLEYAIEKVKELARQVKEKNAEEDEEDDLLGYMNPYDSKRR